jgi:peptidylprolyl isomerase
MTIVSVLLGTAGVSVFAGLTLLAPAFAQLAPQAQQKPRPPVQAPAAAQPQLPAHAPPQVAQAPARPTVAAAPGSTSGLASGNKSSGEVVARVGKIEFTADDIKAQIAGLGAREQNALSQNPNLLSQTVRLLLANQLVLQQAEEKKFDQTPAVAAQLQRARDAALTELYLQSVSTPPAGFPSDEEVQRIYDANRGSLLVPRQFQIAQILIAMPKGSDKATEDKARKKLDDVAKKAKAPGADFAAIARSESDDKAAAGGGGEVGWLLENQLPAGVRAQVVGLPKGAVSEPLQLDDGWHIIKLIDTKASYTATLPEVRDQLIQQMRNERAAALRRAFIADLVNKNPPILNEFALSKLIETPPK